MSAIAFHAAPAAPRLRLTRRGRVVLASLAAIPLVIAGVLAGLGSGGAVASGASSSESLVWVTVDGGDTLWSIASEIAPQEDPREFVAQVAAFNQLSSTQVDAGQRLAIPPIYAD